MRFITTFLLLLAARNVQSLLDFITRLDTTLDGFIAKRDAEFEETQTQINALCDRQDSILSDRASAARLKAGVRSITA